MIYNFKALAENQDWKKAKNQIGISKFKIVKALAKLPNQLQYKTSFVGDYDILTTRKCKSDANVIKYQLTTAYQSVQGLPSAKLKDLLSLCKSNIIPPAYHPFYELFTEKLNPDDKDNEE